MRKSCVIALKELKTYFVSPIGYVVTGSFLFIVGYMFYQRLVLFVKQGLYDGQTANYIQPSLNDAVVKPLYATINIIMLFMVPLITMRLISEEKRSKTLELLLTSPVTFWDIVIGKFCAGMILISISLFCTLIYPVILYIGGNPDLGQVVSMYIGLVFLSSVYVAIGVLWSAVTENQIISAILTFITLVFLWVVDWAVQVVPTSVAKFLSYVSVIKHFEYFGQGVISLKETVYYLSASFLVLMLAKHMLDQNRKLKNHLRIAGAFFVIVLINVSVYFHDVRFDITKDKVNSLSEQTRSVLKGLKEEIHFSAVLEPLSTGPVFKRAMEEYSYFTDKITYDILDRQRTKSRYESITASSRLRNKQVTSISEDELTGAIVSVSRSTNKKIGFLVDHGELSVNDTSSDGASFISDKLRGYGYDVEELSILKGQKPEQFSLVIIAGPTKRISDAETKSLKRYIKNGGNIIVLSSPPLPGSGVGPDGNVNLLTADLGIVFDEGVIIDPASNIMGFGQAVTVVRDLSKASAISSGLKDPAILPYSQSLDLGPAVSCICKSAGSSWLDKDIGSSSISFDEKRDRKGPLAVCGLLCTNNGKACIFAAANSIFINNMYINYGSNYDLIMNVVSFMTGEQELVLNRSKFDKPGYFNAGTSFVVGFFSVYLLPLMILGTGIWSYYRRRK